MARPLLAGLVLAAVLHVGFRRLGPVPPLGPFLDPWNGAWALAAAARWPDADSLQISGLAAPVRVVYDDRGVPHIFATSSEDAARALGYVVARDRLFQLETRWRSAAGRMSELVGEAALEFDRSMRRIDLARSAERDYAEMDPATAVMRETVAYAEGVNAWIDQLGRRDLPLEYRLLGAEPARWQPVYSFYLLKLMGWNLTFFTSDLQRLRLAAVVGRQAADALRPARSPIQQPIQPNGQTAPRYDFAPLPPPGEPDLAAAKLARVLELALGASAAAGVPDREQAVLASNNWAVSPERTADGYALLSGDPHLELTLPAIWYEVHLVVPGELDVYGVTIPSVPYVAIGFNRDVAWSFTNTGADVIDFYEEELDDAERPTRYRVDGEWQPLTASVEEFRGRGGKLLSADTLYFTHRGPLISEQGHFLSMRWTVLEGSPENAALRGTNRASSVETALAAMETFAAPAQNMIVADRSGTIAIRSTGHFPIHPAGGGVEILDGSETANDWMGYWPIDRYPFAIRPQQGYLASANQQPLDPIVDDTYLGADWPSPWRAIRINRLLGSDSAVTVEAMRRYQTDPGNARADFFLPFFIDAAKRAADPGDEIGGRARAAARLLGEWDRRYTKENERAALFEYAMSELTRRAWDELLLPSESGRPQRRVFTPSSTILASLLTQPQSDWWDDRRTSDTVENRDAILVSSLSSALERLEDERGAPEDGGWRWDRVRHANIYHVLGIPALSELELPVQGGSGNLNPSSGGGRHGASWRMVVRLGPEIEAWSIYPGGQSGNPASRYYADRIDTWVEGRLDPLLIPRVPVELAPDRVTSRLQLYPRR
jgi:penicillin amidase